MKNRPILVALFAGLGACATVPAGEPYPMPPGAGPPPLAQADLYCPIVSSRQWQAFVASGAGNDGRPNLVATGTVVTPGTGFTLEFAPFLEDAGGYPLRLLARLRVVPPGAPQPQVPQTHDLRWQWPLRAGPVGSVAILCGDRTLADISPIPSREDQ